MQLWMRTEKNICDSELPPNKSLKVFLEVCAGNVESSVGSGCIDAPGYTGSAIYGSGLLYFKSRCNEGSGFCIVESSCLKAFSSRDSQRSAVTATFHEAFSREASPCT